MYDYFGAACRAFRYAVSCVGFMLSTAFLTYGALMRWDGDDNGIEDDLIIAFGSYVALTSCIIAFLSRTGDHQARMLIEAMNQQLLLLRKTNEELYNRCTTLEELQGRMERSLATQQTNNEKLAGENQKFSAENRQLSTTTIELDTIKNQYRDELLQIRSAHESTVIELDKLRMLADDEKEKVERLETLCNEQRERIAAMTEQLENLNELQRKSTQMIQMLALYGDDCKTLGMSLEETSAELRQTDASLGLTATEMAQQLDALKTVTSQLSQVALDRGVSASEFTSVESS